MSAGQLSKLPDGHVRLDDKNLEKLSVKGNELFWDGKPIVTKTRLSRRAKCWVGITGAAALLAALLSIVTNGHTVMGYFTGYFHKQPPTAVAPPPAKQPLVAHRPAQQQPPQPLQGAAKAPSQTPQR